MPAVENLLRSSLCRFLFFVALFPSALGWLGDEPLFDGGGGHANIANLAVYDSLDPLQVREEAPLGDRRHVGTDTARLLGLTTAPNVASFDRPFSS